MLGDGGERPCATARSTAAICIGAPSIVGTERCFRAMHRALRPGGVAVASDWTWATTRPPPEAVPAGVEAAVRHAGRVHATSSAKPGSRSSSAEPMPQRVWDDYYAPLRVITAEERAANPGMPADPIESEIAAYDAGGEYWQYSLFVVRKS